MEPISVLILAGGRSSRMGRDKVWLDLDGMPLVELIARRLLPLAGEIIFSSNDPSRFGALVERLPVPAIVAADLYQNAGPLAGLHAGLRAARYESIFAVATDMPFVDHSLVTAMIEHCPNVDAIVPRIRVPDLDEPQPEPLHAVYRKSCLPAIEASLLRGRRRMVSFFDDVRVCYIEDSLLREFDPSLRSLCNINTPEEWTITLADLKRELQDGGG